MPLQTWGEKSKEEQAIVVFLMGVGLVIILLLIGSAIFGGNSDTGVTNDEWSGVTVGQRQIGKACGVAPEDRFAIKLVQRTPYADGIHFEDLYQLPDYSTAQAYPDGSYHCERGNTSGMLNG